MNYPLNIFSNSDKSNHLGITPDNDDPLNLTKPFKLLVCGTPNRGKTNTILNIIKRTSPEFSIIYVWHINPYSKDYKNVPHIKWKLTTEHEYVNRFCNDSIQRLPKLLIMDDVNFATMSKLQQENLFKLITFTSSHCNLSIIIVINDFVYLPRRFRAVMSHFIIYKPVDNTTYSIIINRLGHILRKNELDLVFSKFCKSIFDFILFDDIKQQAFLNGSELIK